jgi:parallel beta-helix repeat protein
MSLTKVSYAMINGSPASVLDYGAIGDNATNSTANIQAAVDNNSIVYLPYGTYLTNATLNIPANVTFFGPGTIHYTGTGQAISITGDNVNIEGITVYGEYSGTFLSGSVGIYCNRTIFSPTLNIITTNNINIENVTIYNFGQSGIRGDWWNTFTIFNCTIRNCGQHGILITSPRYGKISNNTISSITPGQTNSGYGISLSRNSSVLVNGVATSLTTTQAPVPFDCFISNNVISSIINYVAIDLHSGNNITIIGNTIQACQMGINLEHASNGANLATCDNITITGNNIYGDGGTTVGYAWFTAAIYIDAQSGAGEIANNVSITGNSFHNHGADASSPFSGAVSGVIYLKAIRGVNITGNTFQTPRGRCVSIFQDSTNVTISGNSVDTLAANDGYQVAFDLTDGSGQGTINNNTIYATGGYAVASTTISTGRGIKVGADNLLTGGIDMADSATLTRIRGGTYLTAARVMVTWNATGTISYTVFEDVAYVSTDITVTKNGTGDFTVAWPAGIFDNARVCAVFSGGDPASGAVYNSQVTSSNATQAVCKTYTSAGAAIDCAENFLMVWGR